MLLAYLTNWKWNSTEFCPTGFRPYDEDDLLPCFQQIALQLPVYAAFAVLNAYDCGFITTRCVTRNRTQLRLIRLRIFLAILLALLPIVKIFTIKNAGAPLYAADVLHVCTECIVWSVHCGYLFSLRHFGSLCHRGSLKININWICIFMLHGIWLRTSLQHDWWPWSLATFIIDVLYGLTLLPKGNAVISTLSSSVDNEQRPLLRQRYTYFHFEFDEQHLGYAQDEASWASRMIFYWVNPLIRKGVAGKLRRIEDLFDLPDVLNVKHLSDLLQFAISHCSSIFRALYKAFGVEFFAIGILRFVADIAGFAGPLLLGGLLSAQAASGMDSESKQSAYLYAFGLFASTLLIAFCSTHFSWRMSLIGMKMRIGIVSAIYRKALETRGLGEARPEILNLMSTDTDRIVNSCISFHSFWSIPFQLFTTLYLLYTQLGAAFIAGVVFAAALIPINRWLASRIGIYSTGLMSAKDARLAATTEIMKGAKQIKINAWEDIFINKLQALRTEELKYLSKRKYLDAVCVYFWATTPVLMCFLTFGVSALLGNPLVAATTYTSIALLNMLIGPLNAFPWVLNGLVESWISIKRVQELLDLPNLDFSTFYNPVMTTTNASSLYNEKTTVLQIKAATFVHNQTQVDDQQSFRLENINLDVKLGDLICIEGPVGAGKSMLISAIVGDAKRIEGEVCVNNLCSGFGLVTQTPWLQRGTIRSNIIWGNTFDEQWYKSVLYACALIDDIEALGGDHIGIGENGHTLSGGQRARIALARAVYQQKKIYLLDDVLSALDAHVAKHVIKHCILRLLQNTTRIIVTRHTLLLFNANQVLHMEDGKLCRNDLINESFDVSFEDSDAEDDAIEKDSSNLIKRCGSISMHQFPKVQDNDGMLQEETRAYGRISLDVLGCYWRAITTPLALTVLLFVLLMQLSRNLSDAWLAYWVTDSTLAIHNSFANTSLNNTEIMGANHSTFYYLSIFALMALTNSIITLIRAFLFAFAGIKAAKFIHEQLLQRVLFAKFSFFDVTSVGRILNRFSSDLYTIDDSLPFILNILLAQIVGLTGALCISLFAMPWLFLLILPMVPMYLNLQHRYRHASRDIKRLSSNALSPLYTHFTETLQGLLTIRTMRASARFQRDFHGKLEESIKAQLTAAAAQQWLGLRLQLLGALLVGGAGILAAITSAHMTNPGMVGLAISYALSITGLLGGVLNAVAETEQEFIAVERVNQFLNLESEENSEGTLEPPFGWPTQAVLSYHDVHIKYRDHLAAALRSINLQTDAFERIGIVGRTGAGKSSMIAAILRIAPLSQGEICLDHINLKSIPLNVLRDRIGVITQEPFIFEGTVRENLDPRRRYYDSEIWHAVKSSAAATLLLQQLGGLDGQLRGNGQNLSAGQRQLLCLARALLKNAKLICIDEGTSNLDDDLHSSVIQALRNSFRSSTILFIAHRLQGLQTMDRILVMEDGTIKEIGKPAELAQNSQSHFHSLLGAQNLSANEFINAN